jgi:hypothetical protein
VGLAETLTDSPDLVEALWPHWNAFIPQIPTHKQLALLMLPHMEAFYGGAAGGAKTSYLCMAALEFVDIPGYSAIIFRRTHTDHLLEKAPGSRIISWIDELSQKGILNSPGSKLGVHFDQSLMKFTFYPSRSTVTLGYIGQTGAKFRYQGSEFQFIGWDELAQHYEEDYTFMFSRLRKTVCPLHKTHEQCEDGSTETHLELAKEGFCACCGKPWSPLLDKGQHKGDPIYVDDCQTCQNAKAIPLRVRATSNPPSTGERGGFGDWIKKRFEIRFDAKQGIYRGHHASRIHVPAFVSDNPHVSQNEYIQSLSNLDPVTREQLLKGNWDVAINGRFRREWMQVYSMRKINPAGRDEGGDFFIMGEHREGNNPYKTFLRRQCICFSTVDPAASQRAGPGDKYHQVWEKRASWTVISTWLLTPNFDLCWLDCVRFQEEIPYIIPAMRKVWDRFRPEYFVVEANGLNKGVYQYAVKEGLPVRPDYPQTDPLVRATDAIVRMEQGRIRFPITNEEWLDPVLHEVFTWVGHPDETDDIICTLSQAASEVSRRSMTTERLPSKRVGGGRAGPSMVGKPMGGF